MAVLGRLRHGATPVVYFWSAFLLYFFPYLLVLLFELPLLRDAWWLRQIAFPIALWTSNYSLLPMSLPTTVSRHVLGFGGFDLAVPGGHRIFCACPVAHTL